MRPTKPKLTLQTTTLWEYPSQHYGDAIQGDKNYEGATPAYVIWNVLQRYTRPGELVLDPMCGSGTTLDVCKDLDRRAIGFDLQPYRPDIQAADARQLPLERRSVDCIFMDPPYSTHIHYSDHPSCIGKLDARASDQLYYRAMSDVFREAYRVLKKGRYLTVYVSDSYSKGKKFCPIGFELFSLLKPHFTPIDIVAVVRHNQKLAKRNWHNAAAEGNFFLRGFNYLLIVKKEKT